MAFFFLVLFLLEFDSHVVHVSELENGVWSLGPKLCSIMVKQEQNLALDLPESQLAASSIPVLNLNPLQRLPVPEEVSPSNHRNHRTVESLRLEKTSKIITSNRQPNTTMTTKPCPKVPYLHVF